MWFVSLYATFQDHWHFMLFSAIDKDFPCKYMVQAANCELGEITTWNPLLTHRSKDFDREMCAKSDLEALQHHTLNTWYAF